MTSADSVFGTNFFEYTVVKKAGKREKMMKFFIISGALVLWGALTFFLFSFMNGVAAIFVPVSLLLFIILAWFLLRFTNLEYDYEISGGEMSMSVVYGGRTRKTLFKKKISEMDEISRLDISKKADLIKNANTFFECISSYDSADLFYLKYNENGKKYLVFFETQKKGEKLFKFYNSSATQL